MTTAPDFMPVLGRGAHRSPENGACVMEYVSILAGERFSDNPSCTDSLLASMARSVNDALLDEHRHLLVPLITRLIGTAGASNSLSTAQKALLGERFGYALDWYRSTFRLVRKPVPAGTVVWAFTKDNPIPDAKFDTYEAWVPGQFSESAARALVARLSDAIDLCNKAIGRDRDAEYPITEQEKNLLLSTVPQGASA